MLCHTRELGGGVVLHTVETNKFKTDCISVNFVMPLERETVTRVALLRGLLLRGSEGYPTFEKLSARTDELYGADVSIETSAFGNLLVLSVTAVSLAGRYSVDGTDIIGGVCDLLRRICFFPVTENGGFSPEYTQSEKLRLKDEIEAKINDKGEYAGRRLGEIMYGDGYGGISKLGYAEDLDGITATGAYLFYRGLVSRCPVHVYTVGGMTAEEAEYRVTTIFDGVERDCDGDIHAIRGHKRGVSVKRVAEEMDVKQGKLAIGYRTSAVLSDGRDYASMLVANEIFGSSPVSKLFMHVREELNLCYHCGSAYRAVNGAVTVAAGIDCTKLSIVLEAIEEMLGEVQRGDFDDGELEIAKKSIVSGVRAGFDSARYIISFFIARELCGISDTPEALVARILDVSRDDVCRAARELSLDTVYFLCNDKKAAEEQL
ncbi:MAG: insulinase family protein [Clostridia bacterium]|nr:insulinase family protein [Clostridia bacterium]